MIAPPLYLIILALCGSLVLSVVWPQGAWIELLAPAIVTVGLTCKGSGIIYVGLAASFLIDILFGMPVGSMCAFYLPCAYLGVRAGYQMNIRSRWTVIITSGIIFLISLGIWFLITGTLAGDIAFPFGLPSLAVGSILAGLLWKPSLTV
ncbi:MAG TPA: hypothetical protein PK014_10345 [Thermoanaerobaculia bacterium]|nr:hypothetical protein [Thermoanaerobaculia bacterium]HUM30519.1 hypothetical protein [Thermoanaerobaculia bacterium]HXK68711.1 hypothetical protein [Thermoanaerobaculia bacterium]